jgi:hypothetical protein
MPHSLFKSLRYPCFWHLDRRWHDRRQFPFGLGAHGIAYRHGGFDQPLSSNSRSQSRIAASGVRRIRPRTAQSREGISICRNGRSPQRWGLNGLKNRVKPIWLEPDGTAPLRMMANPGLLLRANANYPRFVA